MKKILILALILTLLLPLISCGDKPAPGENDKIEIPEMNPPMPLPELPVIDGSSSTVMMHAAIRAYLTDAHYMDTHSQTYAALERIVPGSDDPADVILAVKYYDETLREIKERGADLVITPVAKEGFVFILHKDNPVKSLTQQQLRDIYSGKIINWKEVGGKDEEIIPYIRNWDSGSQTAMEDFMGGEPIIGENESIIGGMMLLLSQVQTTGSAGIGYNIYSWSMGQNLDIMGLKAVAVDGVKPENKTLSDSSYPLMVYTYSYYNKGNEKGKALTDWLLTAEGQKVIASAGYVGIFGELPPIETPVFNRDETDAYEKIHEYYNERNMTHKGKWDTYNDLTLYYLWSERLSDKAQTEALAGGKGKDLTFLFLAHLEGAHYAVGEVYRYIVLTREKGGEFEVINEGEVLSYEDGVMIPKSAESVRESLPETIKMSVNREGMEEIFAGTLAFSERLGYAVYLLPDFELREEKEFDLIAPKSDSPLMPGINMRIYEADPNEPMPESEGEYGKTPMSDYMRMTVGGRRLEIQMNYPYEATEGGAVLLKAMIETIQ